MNADTHGGASETIIPVEYDEFAGQSFEASHRGQGTLVIRGTGLDARFIFFPPARSNVALTSSMEFIFSARRIWDVTVEGRRISFDGVMENHPAPVEHFAFYCVTAEEAAATARLLPERKEADFTAHQEFVAKLHRLPEAGSPWTTVTVVLIVANVLVFIAMGLAGAGWLSVASMKPYFLYGANNAALTTDGQWWRLVSSNFIHFGLLHLALNMWALFQAGQLLEKLLGRTLFTLVYFGGGLTGSLLTLFWHGDRAWSAGASGAVFGLYGAMIGYMLREKHTLPKTVYRPVIQSAAIFTIYNLGFGLAIPGIDNASHIGGLIGGLLFGWLVAVPVDLEPRQRLTPQRLKLGAVVLAVIAVVGSVAARAYYRQSDGFLSRKAGDHRGGR